MAGFKGTIVDYNPVLFLTFDGDAFNVVSGELSASPLEIIDESPYGNFGILHSDDTGTHFGYRLGLPSLLELEASGQACMSFAYNGYQPTAPQGPWAKAFIEVTHQSQYDFYNGSTKLGDFTVGFMLNKAQDELSFRTATVPTVTGDLKRTFIRKENVFEIGMTDRFFATDTFDIVTPGGTLSVTIPTLPNFYARDHLIVLTWQVINPNPGEYVGTATVYFDSRAVASQSWAFEGAPPNTSQVSSIEIAGTIAAGGSTFNDRQTTDTRLDQIFLLDFAITSNDVARLWRKTKSYETLVRYSNPSTYWIMGDAESPVYTVMDAAIGLDGTYVGGTSKVIREQTGPTEIPGSKSVFFLNGGGAIAGLTNSIMFNPVGDYTIAFWAKTQNSDRSVILSIQSDTVPYPGMALQLNWADNGYRSGALQFSISDDYRVSSAANLMSDGGWHFIVMIRRGTEMELWVDGVLIGSETVPVFLTAYPGRVYLMGMMPGKLATNGYLAQIELHNNYALQPHEITMRATYRSIYKVSGVVTLQGQPYPARIRLMDHQTGELIREVTADPNTGEYETTIYNNTNLTLLALNPNDSNVRPRVYGPVVPSYFPDTV